VGPVSDTEADAYFNSRARISRLGAGASDQSRPLPSRAELERRVAELDARYPGDTIPRPANWSGFRVAPQSIEFWQDMPFRLHDRRVYTAAAGGWTIGSLYP
jgi:pyridoxamine 5'-phosphate oxidase